ncbi:MAG: T9SS type A sorting domain-containing protein [Bacteroidetes bacterium]|nr:T9SS type A sorting domain-containing protein [Bacteroidota bacterium]
MRSFTYILCLISIQLSAQTGIIWSEPIMISDETTGYDHPRIALTGDDGAVVIWGNEGDMYFSRQEGISFTTPLMLNSPETSISTFSWAGPDIASKGDTIYIVFKEEPEDMARIYCVASYDGGITFDTLEIVDGMIGDHYSRFPSVTVKEDGNPAIAFMKLNTSFLDPKYVVVTSDDFGNSFNMDVTASNFSGGEVCDCCPVGITAKDNYVVTLYRDNLDNLRNSWAGISTDGGISFENGIQIDQTDWTVFACPASGPDGVIIGDNLYSVFMSAGEGDSRVYFSTSSLTEFTDEPDMRVSPEFEGLSVQNYPRIASFGNAVAMVWKQVENSKATIPISFTNDINNGFPPDYDTIAYLDFYGLENADVAVSSNKVHVVWQDNYSNAVMYREGTYVEPVLLEEATTQNVIKVFPNPAESAFNINSEIGLETIRLYDAQQGIVKNLDLNGNKIVNIPINKLTPGLFLIVIKDVNGAVHTEKIIIQ